MVFRKNPELPTECIIWSSTLEENQKIRRVSSRHFEISLMTTKSLFIICGVLSNILNEKMPQRDVDKCSVVIDYAGMLSYDKITGIVDNVICAILALLHTRRKVHSFVPDLYTLYLISLKYIRNM